MRRSRGLAYIEILLLIVVAAVILMLTAPMWKMFIKGNVESIPLEGTPTSRAEQKFLKRDLANDEYFGSLTIPEGILFLREEVLKLKGVKHGDEVSR